LKAISEREFVMFLENCSQYFTYIADIVRYRKASALVKILGMFEVEWKDSRGEFMEPQFIVAMPNLMYCKKFTHVFDLKGSSRGRFVSTENSSNVLQDGNFAKYNRGMPLTLTVRSINLLQNSLNNDTAFLSNLGVMDYSLLVGIDEKTHQISVGIIDYFRRYTIDKQFESHMKSVVTLFGQPAPTVIPPDMYRQRILNAMSFNFMASPSRTYPIEKPHSVDSVGNISQEENSVSRLD